MNREELILGKVLALVGSPRQGGNCDLLTGSFLQGAREKGAEAETIYLNRLNIRPCQGCDGCAADGVCVIPDDMQIIYRKVQTSSGIVLASPIYFGGLSAQTKMFIDRFQCWWQAKYRLRKPSIAGDEQRPAFFICVGAREDKECFEAARSVARLFFLIINLRLIDTLYFSGYDGRGSVSLNREALRKARLAGQRFVSHIT